MTARYTDEEREEAVRYCQQAALDGCYPDIPVEERDTIGYLVQMAWVASPGWSYRSWAEAAALLHSGWSPGDPVEVRDGDGVVERWDGQAWRSTP